MKTLSLLVKSVSPKNTSGFALYGNPPRWHKIGYNKPIPKGAPIAAHPHAAGVPVPAKHFTDEQWAQLHLPAENVNAPTHNKQLQKLKELSESGDVTGILGSNYGSNTYGVKLSKVANALLDMHGVPHKVSPGQKAGEHAAVQSAPEMTMAGTYTDLAGTTKVINSKKDATGLLSDEANGWLYGYQWETNNEHPDNVLNPIPSDAVIKELSAFVGSEPVKLYRAVAVGAGSDDGGKLLESWTANKKHAVDLKDANAELGQKMKVISKVFNPDQIIIDTTKLPKSHHIENESGTQDEVIVALGSFHEKLKAVRSDHSPVLSKDEAISAAIDHLTEDSKQGDMPAGEKAEDVALIAKLKTAQSIKLKQGTIALKTPLTATKTDFGDYQIHHAGIPDGSFIAAKDLTIKDGMVVGVKPALAAKLGLETAGEVQSKTALTQKKETEKAEAVAKEKASVDKQAKLIGGALGLASAVSSGKMTAADANEKMKGIKAGYDEPAPKDGETKPASDGGVLVFKDGHWHKKDAPAPQPASIGKLSQIPWDKQYLPDTNVNAPSHNKAITKIKAMADAGDVVGLQAFIDSKANAKQNYAKKQGLLAKVALAALTEGDAPPVAPAPVAVVAPAPAPAPEVKKGKFAEMVADSVGDLMPDLPVFKDYNYSTVGKKWQQLLSEGNNLDFFAEVNKLVATIKKKPAMGNNEDVQKLVKYALDLNKWVAAKKQTATDAAVVAAPPTPAAPADSDYETFHNTEEGHNKFWSVAVAGNKVYKKWGAIGTKGQTLIAEFPSPEAAKKAASKDKAVKKSNGYSAISTDDQSQTPLDGWVTSVSSGKVPTVAQVAAFEKLSPNMQNNWLQAAVDKHPLLQNPKWDEDATEEAMDDVLSLHQKGVYAHDQAVASTGVPVKPKLLIPSLAGAAGFAEDKMKEGDKVALLKLKQTWSEMPGEQAKMLTAYIGECIDYLGGDKGDPAPVSSAVKPVKPTGLSPSFSGVAGLVEEKIKQGDKPALISLKDLWAHKVAGDQTQKIKDYIDAGIASLGGDDSPKDGDTKQGANGVTLVFKNGRWHKQHVSDDPVLDEWAADIAAGKQPTFSDAQHVQSTYLDGDDMDFIIDAIGNAGIDVMDEMENDDGSPLDVLDYVTNLHQKALASLGENDEVADDDEDLDSVTVPDYAALSGSTSLVQKVAAQFQEESEGLLAYAKLKGSAGLAKYVTVNPNGTITVDNQNGFKVNLMDYSDSFADMSQPKYARLNAMYHFVKKLVDLAPDTSATEIPSMSSWVQVGGQLGSNEGGRFRDENGVEWYCKFPKSEAIAKSEVLASNLYALAGVAGQDAKLVSKGGLLAVASRWQSVNKASASVLAATEGTLDGFGADAWLANWDVVGIGNDNLQIGANGKVVRIDAGGALMYRAQGGKKAFGDNVSELDSLRDSAVNPHAASVFGKMSKADITASIAKIVAIKNSDIKSMVEKYGPGSTAEKIALYETLVARKNDMLAKYPKAATPPKKRLDPTKLPVQEKDLPKAFDFNTMGEGGSPLSSKPMINTANNEAINLMRQVALAGNLTALKDFKFPVFDKNSGTHTGEYRPIDQHPSKHVIQYHQDLIDVLSEIADPPKPLVMTNMLSAGTIEELNAAFPPKKFGTTVASVKSNEKFGFWLALGGITGDVSKLRPKKISDYSAKSIAAGYEKFKQGSALAKHFIKKVQYNTTYNYLFRNGLKKDHEGNDLKDVAKAALEHSSTQPEGTTIYRWQNMTDSMVKKILLAADGTVFQANGPMCTSYDPHDTQHFGTHRLVIRYAKGARGVDSFGSKGYPDEKEVTTLPNARFVILSKNMVNNETGVGGKRLELELLMLPPDLAL